ncbi:MAG: 2-polyprenylphenol 6-hydroxylase [Pseudomonadota bacterium]
MNSVIKPKLNLGRIFTVRRVCKKYALADLADELVLPRSAKFLLRWFAGGRDKTELPRALRLRLALEELGPVFIKLGQTLSTRPDLIPSDLADELCKLQDEVPPFANEDALALVKQAYGKDFEAIFAEVESEPLAAASVAQVHSARLNPGLAIVGQDGVARDEVVIKVIRPDIEPIIRRDLEVMRFLAGKLQKYWSRGQQLKPLEVVQEYQNTILGELDLRVEAAHGARMGANFEEHDIIYVPRVYWDFTSKNVLVMERIYGTSIRDRHALVAQGVDLKQLAADGVEVFFKQAFEDNFFHADMHPGNIFVSEAGKWIAIDFGIMGTLEEQDKQYLAQILLGFFNRDYERITRAHFQSGWIPADTKPAEFELAIRIVCEPIFAKPLSEISFGKVLLELFQTVREFEMPVQPQLVLLYKTLLNIEGLGRQLYPDLNLWDTAKPFLEKWVEEQLSPKALLEDLLDNWPLLKVELQNWLRGLGK